VRPLAAPLAGAVAAAVLLLGGCSRAAPEPEPEATEIPEELAGEAPRPLGDEGIGTPMDERVATLGLLNKRNNITREIELSPGESRRIGDVIVRLSACERTAPWENPPETGAFVQVLVLDRPEANAQGDWRRVFSGWLFRNSPGLNVVEHPIYDVWVKDCRMSFPGEEGGPATPPASPTAPAPAPRPTPTEAAAPDSAANEA
jgi:hypothetical protein